MKDIDQMPVMLEVDLVPAIQFISNAQRKDIIIAVLSSINQEGVIDEIREIVNDPKWND